MSSRRNLALKLKSAVAASASSTPVRTLPPAKFNRNDRPTSSKDLSSLISLYHLTTNFPSLVPSEFSSYIDNTFIKDSSYSPIQPSNFRTLAASKKRIAAEAIKLDHPAITMQDLDLSLLLPTSDYAAAGSLHSNSDGKYADSFQKNWVYGAEAPLRQRARRALDVLHGTEAGGQAGLLTMKESGQDLERLNQVRREQIKEKEQLDMMADEEAALFAREFETA